MPFSGSGVAIITPLKNDRIDFDAYGKLLDFHAKNKTDAIVVCGTTGESATLTVEEQKRLIQFTAEHARGMHVTAGVGSNSTHKTVELARWACGVSGVDSLLVITPYYNKPSQAGLVAHFSAVAEVSTRPIIMYNVPGRTGVNMTAATTLELAKVKNIAGVKEASGDLNQISEICAHAPKGFAVLSGDDALTLPILSVGGVGVISVTANVVPERLSRLVHAWLEGRRDEARDIHHQLLKLNQTMFVETNPVPVKTAVNLLAKSGKYGLPDCGHVRLPLVELQKASLDKLVAAMREFGLEV
ncbi:4-hydroxy-tetrahydrodipicolinate synthase [bacterium]|nr:4-hydroxy-tetrahydrodipicolinate synthase [bacterium]